MLLKKRKTINVHADIKNLISNFIGCLWGLFLIARIFKCRKWKS